MTPDRKRAHDQDSWAAAAIAVQHRQDGERLEAAGETIGRIGVVRRTLTDQWANEDW